MHRSKPFLSKIALIGYFVPATRNKTNTMRFTSFKRKESCTLGDKTTLCSAASLGETLRYNAGNRGYLWNTNPRALPEIQWLPLPLVHVPIPPIMARASSLPPGFPSHPQRCSLDMSQTPRDNRGQPSVCIEQKTVQDLCPTTRGGGEFLRRCVVTSKLDIWIPE